MAVPTVGSVVASGAITADNQTTITLTLTAGVSVGNYLVVAVGEAGSTGAESAVDSKNNTYLRTAVPASGIPAGVYLFANILNALSIGDTITVTLSAAEHSAAAFAFILSGLPQNQNAVNGFMNQGTNKAGTSASALTNSTTPSRVTDDVISFLFVGIWTAGAGVVASDFTSGSVDSGYTVIGSKVSTAGSTSGGICVCYKTITAQNPMPAQNPTFTLNTSKAWQTNITVFSGLMARGSVGTNPRAGEKGGNSYVPIQEGTLGKLRRGSLGKTTDDSWPNTPITPQTNKVGQQEPDYTLVSS